MGIYTSQGTIRIRCDIGASGGNDCKATIYFVPENDYSIKHRNESYAVFVPMSESCKNAIIRKYNPDKGGKIEIVVAGIGRIDIISFAAMHQKKVEVEVEVKTTLEEAAESKISEVASEIMEKIHKNVDEISKREAVEKVMKATLQKLVGVANNPKQCFKLTGITIPAQ